MKTVLRMLLVVIFLVPLLLHASESHTGYVNGDNPNATVTFSTEYATFYTISASPTGDWVFTDAFAVSGYSGWYKSASYSAKCEKLYDNGELVTTVWVDAATAFSVTINGKMYKPGGYGGSLVDWSVTGSSSAGAVSVIIDPSSAVIAVGDSKSFAYKTDANAELYGLWWDSSKAYPFTKNNYVSTGAAYSFSCNTAGPYFVQVARNGLEEKLAVAPIKNVEVASVSAGTSPNDIVSTTDNPTNAPVYCVPKKTGTSTTITATPNPGGAWPTHGTPPVSYPSWAPDTSQNGPSYSHPTTTAGLVTITASCGTSSKVIKVATIEVTLTRTSSSICAKPNIATIPTAWGLASTDFEKDVDITTNPTGYEYKAILTIESLAPTQTSKGSITKINNSKWQYTSLTEAQGNLYPGGNTGYWTVKVKDSFSKKEVSIMVKSVFTFLVTSSLANKQDKAIEYVKWKYSSVLSGKTIGSYANFSDYGKYTVAYGIQYGNKCFEIAGENILASTMLHEHYHTTQSVTLRPLGALSMADYLINVALGIYPDPPNVPTGNPSMGLDWAALELPAHYYERSYKNQTGIIYNSSYYTRVLDWIVFFEYLSTHATGP